MELLIKEIDQLKAHNIKIAKELTDLREQKKTAFRASEEEKIRGSANGKKRRMQITHMVEFKVNGHESEVSTPIHQHYFDSSSENEKGSGLNDSNIEKSERHPHGHQLDHH